MSVFESVGFLSVLALLGLAVVRMRPRWRRAELRDFAPVFVLTVVAIKPSLIVLGEVFAIFTR